MKISQIKIENYRLLKDFSIQMEEVLSLVIGKNNCGKTSFLSLLERFLHSNEQNRFTFDDFNIESLEEIKTLFTNNAPELSEEYGIYLKLYITYDEKDNLSNISLLMLDLDPTIRTAILSFEYTLDNEHYLKLKKDFEDFKAKIDTDLNKRFENTDLPREKQDEIRSEAHKKKDLIYFLRKYHDRYFAIKKKGLEYNNESNYVLLDKADLSKILNFKRIKAKRDVINEDGTTKNSDRTLSKMSSKYYDKISNADAESEHIAQLQNELSETDDKLNKVYKNLFENVINKVKKFGGIKQDESKLLIVSSLEERNLLSNNTTVMYEHGNDHCLPEDYNGLGYMNLIAMIFEIEVLLSDFKRTKIRDEKPADLNLLFIEEPEAHTHPQLQYIFIKNIKSILLDASLGAGDGICFNLQTIITTHSSHITAESEFDDIKYFYRESHNAVITKNLRDLRKEYEASNPRHYQFLKQYLTINKAELFFADKAILIEGDTERLLIAAIMKKMDIEHNDPNCTPLLSQNISVVEVGAYSQMFEKFLCFLGTKALIVTDLDSCKTVKLMDEAGKVKKNKKGEDRETIAACPVSEGTVSSNSAINYFFPGKDIKTLQKFTIDNKKFKKDFTGAAPKWVEDAAGPLCVVYQTEENSYNARSFEDAFINLNLSFLKTKKDEFKSLKNRDEFDETSDPFILANSCIDKKPLFVLDILFHSDAKFSNWIIPNYIKEGLLWLKY